MIVRFAIRHFSVATLHAVDVADVDHEIARGGLGSRGQAVIGDRVVFGLEFA